MTVDSDKIVERLLFHYCAKGWMFFPEFRTGTGYTHDSQQYLDALAMSLMPGTEYHRIAFEVKVSRSDFLREIKSPKKRRLGLFLSNQFYFAAPAGLIKIEEVPPECGLKEVREDGTLWDVVHAPWRDAGRPTWGFVAAMIRRCWQQNGFGGVDNEWDAKMISEKSDRYAVKGNEASFKTMLFHTLQEVHGHYGRYSRP